MKPFMRLKQILIALSLVAACGSAYSQIDITKTMLLPATRRPYGSP